MELLKMRMLRLNLFLCLISLFLPQCAVLHHVQIGDVQSHPDFQLRPFEIKVSETGINIREASKLAKAASRSAEGTKAIGDIQGIISMFQQGPRTGNAVFTDSYAQNIIYRIHERCPSGRVTGLKSIRETRKYPVISGEIVKIVGYCMYKRTKS